MSRSLMFLHVIIFMNIVINGLTIEIKEGDDSYWKNKKILIYDVSESNLNDKEVGAIVSYLYEEGFIEDRRTEFEIIKPED